jgi:hypothetical protein
MIGFFSEEGKERFTCRLAATAVRLDGYKHSVNLRQLFGTVQSRPSVSAFKRSEVPISSHSVVCQEVCGTARTFQPAMAAVRSHGAPIFISLYGSEHTTCEFGWHRSDGDLAPGIA